jgi:hypothetical protein
MNAFAKRCIARPGMLVEMEAHGESAFAS